MLSTFAAAVLLMMAAPATAAREVILAQVTHRHGARTPIVPAAFANVVCGDAGCGNLNVQGKAMLEALGQFMSARYVWGNWSHFDAADAALAAPPQADFAALQSGQYSFQRVQSRSTSVPRTLQSSGAMLRGLFPNYATLDSLPSVIYTVALETDTLLLSDLTVGLYIPVQYLKEFPPLSDWSEFASYIPPATLKELGLAFGFDLAACQATVAAMTTNVWAYRGCALEVGDVASSFYATGDLAKYPTVVGNYSQLKAFAKANNQRVYQYNTSDPTDVARGPVLYPLAQMLVSNMQMRAAQLNATPSPTVAVPVVYEYSAHDTTVMPVAAFLGHNEQSLPPFGQAYVVELVRDTASGEHYVQAWQGAPGTMAPPPTGTPITAEHYQYNMASLSIGCRRGGANVMVADGTCTLDEFNAYIQSIAPQTAAGSTCYLPPAVIAQIGCDKPEAPATIACEAYRAMCPQYACPTGTYSPQGATDSGDFTCYSETALGNASAVGGEVKVGEAAAAAIGSAIGGVLLGVMVTLAFNMLCKCWTKPKSDGYVQA